MEICYIDKETRSIADLVPMLEGYTRTGPKSYLITRINVPEQHRRKGHGTALLKRILADADKEGVILYIQPMTSGSMSNRRLIYWYRKYGFVNKGDYFVRVPADEPPYILTH